ncbi:MAG: DUF805 domain-containing protein [Tannerella sp.]|jgi:uncharacterized membrane protein YhaH (DUF805 family)|nr:DUF805 domain-containing protein [Tannerella sp.]
MNWYLQVIKKYATFSGRARRKEFWMFVLFNSIFVVVAMILDRVLGTGFDMSGQSMEYGWIYTLYCLCIFIPGLAVCIRRLHDVGKSGWFYLICLIPLIGAIWLLVLFCTEGQSGDNEYGADPKQEVA